MVKRNEEDIDSYRADSRARGQALAHRQIVKTCKEYVEKLYQARISEKARNPFEMHLPEFVACLMPTVETAYCTARTTPICYACSGTKHHCPLSVVKQLYAIGSEFESARNLFWEAGIDRAVVINTAGEPAVIGDELAICSNFIHEGGRGQDTHVHRCKLYKFCGYPRELADKCEGYEPITSEVPMLRTADGLEPIQAAVLRSSTYYHDAFLGRRDDWEDPEYDYSPESGNLHFGPLRNWAGIPDYEVDTLTLAKDLLKEAWYFVSIYKRIAPPEEQSAVQARIGNFALTYISDRDSNWNKQ